VKSLESNGEKKIAKCVHNTKLNYDGYSHVTEMFPLSFLSLYPLVSYPLAPQQFWKTELMWPLVRCTEINIFIYFNFFCKIVGISNLFCTLNIAYTHIYSYIHIISYHIISYHIISYHIISYHIIYHIISYHIISYHIISSYFIFLYFI